MVVAVQQLLAECTAIFAMCILKHHPQPQLSSHQLPTYVDFFSSSTLIENQLWFDLSGINSGLRIIQIQPLLLSL